MAEGIGQPDSHAILGGGIIGLGKHLPDIHWMKVLVSMTLHPIWVGSTIGLGEQPPNIYWTKVLCQPDGHAILDGGVIRLGNWLT